jgi:hypothetical protein
MALPSKLLNCRLQANARFQIDLRSKRTLAMLHQATPGGLAEDAIVCMNVPPQGTIRD